MSLEWNVKHQCWDLKRERPIRNLPFRTPPPRPKSPFWAIVLLLIIAFVVSNIIIAKAHAEPINMSIIAEIESSNNPKAVSDHGAVGMYQVTQCVVDEYNTFVIGSEYFSDSVNLNHCFDEKKCFEIANWYMNKRIPQLLKYAHKKDTIQNRLWAYNAGIGNVAKNRMPKETRNYIKKYFKLAGVSNA